VIKAEEPCRQFLTIVHEQNTVRMVGCLIGKATHRLLTLELAEVFF
jgi:hypothetical protein